MRMRKRDRVRTMAGSTVALPSAPGACGCAAIAHPLRGMRPPFLATGTLEARANTTD
jgi:hypothetical protein